MLVTLCSLLIGSCARLVAAGFSITLPDGTTQIVSTDAAELPLRVGGEKPLRLFFAAPLVFPQGHDLVLHLKGSVIRDGTKFSVSALYKKKPLGRIDFTLSALPQNDLHVRAAFLGGLRIDEVDVHLAEGELHVTGCSVAPSFVGFYTEADAASFDASSSARIENGALRLALAVPSAPYTCSLVVTPAENANICIQGESLRSLSAYVAAGSTLALPAALLRNDPAIQIHSDAPLLHAFFEPDEGAPKADLYAILALDTPIKGDYALYRWDLFPKTLVFDFVDYKTQDKYLKRLAFFAEKPGFRGRIANDAEIQHLHGWNAHDYSPTTLAAFFEKARQLAFVLLPEEKAFFDILTSFGIIAVDSAGHIVAGEGAVVSISRQSSKTLRRLFLDHEASHALFFQDAEYRKLAESVWASLNPDIRRFWKQHFAWRSYDVTDEYLCINELQAYLVQQPVSSARAYYENVITTLEKKLQDERIGKSRRDVLDNAESDAKKFHSYLRTMWGLGAGRFGRLIKL